MGKVVVMPKLGLTMTEARWTNGKKNEGDAVKGAKCCSPYPRIS